MAITDIETVTQTGFLNAVRANYHDYITQISTGMCFMLSLKWLELGLCQHRNIDTIMRDFYALNPHSGAYQELILNQAAYADNTAAPGLPGVPNPRAGGANPPPSTIINYFLRSMTHDTQLGVSPINACPANTHADERRLATYIDHYLTGVQAAPAGKTISNAAEVCIDSDNPGHPVVRHAVAFRLIGGTYYVFDPGYGVKSSTDLLELFQYVNRHHQLSTPIFYTVLQIVH